MNKIYKLKFDRKRQQLIVVSELATGAGKDKTTGDLLAGALQSGFGALTWLSGKLTPVALGLLLTATLPALSHAADLPTGGQIVGGQGQISTSGNQMTIHQQTQKLAANWQSFDIGANHSVQFIQPDSSAIALNRVTGQSASQIMGQLSANGKVFLINPNGVMVGKGATVNTAGFLASTKNLSVSDFMQGNYRLNGGSAANAEIINQGSLTTTKGGFIVLAADKVRNEGTISTPDGTTVLAAAQQVTLTLDSNGLTGVSVNGELVNALVENKGLISARDGKVYLTARGQDMLVKTVVNNTGIIDASSMTAKDGVIHIGSGDSATVSATASTAAGTGGGNSTNTPTTTNNNTSETTNTASNTNTSNPTTTDSAAASIPATTANIVNNGNNATPGKTAGELANPASGAANSANGNPANPGGTAANTADGNSVNPASGAANSASGNPANPGGTAANTADGNSVNPASGAANSANGNPANPGGTAANPANGNPTNPTNPINTLGITDASGISTHAGEIHLDGGTSGVVSQAGKLLANSASGKGGKIFVEGKLIHLAKDSRTEATGATGGGEVLVGGGWQGKDSRLRNSERLVMDKTASINVSASQRGDGGTAVLWSDIYTYFGGNITARGGAQGGDGGKVETSSKDFLRPLGTVSASSSQGKNGQWLLDPYNIYIQNDPADVDSIIPSTGMKDGASTSFFYGAPLPRSHVSVKNIVRSLEDSTNVLIDTHNDTGGDVGLIEISPNTIIRKTRGGNSTLTLRADDRIDIYRGVVFDGSASSFNLELIAKGSRIKFFEHDINVRLGEGRFQAQANTEFNIEANNTRIAAGLVDITALKTINLKNAHITTTNDLSLKAPEIILDNTILQPSAGKVILGSDTSAKSLTVTHGSSITSSTTIDIKTPEITVDASQLQATSGFNFATNARILKLTGGGSIISSTGLALNMPEITVNSGTLQAVNDLTFTNTNIKKVDIASGTLSSTTGDIKFTLDQMAPATVSALTMTGHSTLTAANNINITLTGNGAAGNTSPVFTSGDVTYSAKKTDINITAKGQIAGAMQITGPSIFESPLTLNATAANDATIVDDASGQKNLVSVADGAKLTLNGSSENSIKATTKDGRAIAIGGEITSKSKLTLNGTSAAGTGIRVEGNGNLTADGAGASFVLAGHSTSGTGVALKGTKPLTGISVDGSTDTGIGVEVSSDLRNVSHLKGISTSTSALPSAGARTGVLLTGNTKLTNTQIEGEAVNGIGVNIKDATTTLDESKGNGVQGDKTSRITGKITGTDTSGVAVVVGSSVHGHQAVDDIMHINGTATGNGEAIRLENAITLTNVSLDGNASGTGYAVNVTGGAGLSNANITGTNKAAPPPDADMTTTVQGGAVRIGGTGTLTSDASSHIKGIIESAKNTAAAVTLADTVTVNSANISGNASKGTGIELNGSDVKVNNTDLNGTAKDGGIGVKLAGVITGGKVTGNATDTTGVEVAQNTVITDGTTVDGTTNNTMAANSIGVKLLGNNTLNNVKLNGTSEGGKGVVIEAVAGTDGTNNVLNGDKDTIIKGITGSNSGVGVELHSNVKGKDTETMTTMGVDTVKMMSIIGETKDGGNGSGLVVNISNPLAESLVNVSLQGLAKGSGDAVQINSSASLNDVASINGNNSGGGHGVVIDGGADTPVTLTGGTVSGKTTSGDAVVIDSATVKNSKIIGTADTTSNTATSGKGIVVTGSGVQLTGTTLKGDSKAAARVKASAGVDFASAATLGTGTQVSGNSTTNTGVHIAGALINDASVKINGNVTGEGADVSTDATGITVAANVNGGTLKGEAKHGGTGIIVKPSITLENLTGSTGKSDTGIGVALQGHNTLNTVVLTGESQQNKGVVISAASGADNLLQGNNATVITGITHGTAGISGVELLTNVNGNTTTRTDDNKDPIMRIIGKAEGNKGASGLTVNIADRLDPALVNVSLEGQSDGTGDATTIDSSLKLNDHARISGDNKGATAQGRGLVIGKTGSPAVTLEGGKVSGSSEAKDGVTVTDKTALKHTTVSGSSTNGIAVNLTSSSTLNSTTIIGTTSRGIAIAVQKSGDTRLVGDYKSSISGTVKKAKDAMTDTEIADSDTGTGVDLMTEVYGGEALITPATPPATMPTVTKMKISGTTSGKGDAIKLSQENMKLTNTTLEANIIGDGTGTALNITNGAQLVSTDITGTDKGNGKGTGVKISGKVESSVATGFPEGTAPDPITGSSTHGDGISLAANAEVVNSALNGSTVDGKGVHFAGSGKLNNAPVTGTSTGRGIGVATDGGILEIKGTDKEKKTITGIASTEGSAAISVKDTHIKNTDALVATLDGKATGKADGVHFSVTDKLHDINKLTGITTTGTAQEGKAVINDGPLTLEDGLTPEGKDEKLHSSITGTVDKGQPGDAVVLNGDVSGAGKQTKITGTADSGKGVTVAKDITLANLQVNGTSVSNIGVALDGHNSLTDVELIGKSTDSTGVKIAASADADPAHNVLTGTKNTTITGTTDGAGKGVELLTNVNGGNRMDGDTKMMTITGDASGNKGGTGLVVNIGTPLAPKSLVNVSLNGNADGSGNAVEINSDLMTTGTNIRGSNTGTGAGIVIDGKGTEITLDTDGNTVHGSSVSAADGVRLADKANVAKTTVTGSSTGGGTGINATGNNTLSASTIDGSGTSTGGTGGTGVHLGNKVQLASKTTVIGITDTGTGVSVTGTDPLKGDNASTITGTAKQDGGTGVDLATDIDGHPAGSKPEEKMHVTGTTEGNGDGVKLTKKDIELTDVIVKGLATGTGGTAVNITNGAKLVSTDIEGTDSGTSKDGTGVKLSGEVIASTSASPDAKPGKVTGHSEKGDGIAVSPGATVTDTALAGTTADGNAVHTLGSAKLHNAPVKGTSTGNGSGITTGSGTLTLTGDDDKKTLAGIASGAGGTAVTVEGTTINRGKITGTATGSADGVHIKGDSTLNHVVTEGAAENGNAVSTEGNLHLKNSSNITGTVTDGTGDAVVLNGMISGFGADTPVSGTASSGTGVKFNNVQVTDVQVDGTATKTGTGVAFSGTNTLTSSPVNGTATTGIGVKTEAGGRLTGDKGKSLISAKTTDPGGIAASLGGELITVCVSVVGDSKASTGIQLKEATVTDSTLTTSTTDGTALEVSGGTSKLDKKSTINTGSTGSGTGLVVKTDGQLELPDDYTLMSNAGNGEGTGALIEGTLQGGTLESHHPGNSSKKPAEDGGVAIKVVGGKLTGTKLNATSEGGSDHDRAVYFAPSATPTKITRSTIEAIINGEGSAIETAKDAVINSDSVSVFNGTGKGTHGGIGATIGGSFIGGKIHGKSDTDVGLSLADGVRLEDGNHLGESGAADKPGAEFSGSSTLVRTTVKGLNTGGGPGVAINTGSGTLDAQEDSKIIGGDESAPDSSAGVGVAVAGKVTGAIIEAFSTSDDGVTTAEETTLTDTSVTGKTTSTDKTKSGVHTTGPLHMEDSHVSGINTGAGAGATTDGDLLGKSDTTNSVSGDTTGGRGDALVINSENVVNVDLNGKSKEGDGATFSKPVNIKKSSINTETASTDPGKSGTHFKETATLEDSKVKSINKGTGKDVKADKDIRLVRSELEAGSSGTSVDGDLEVKEHSHVSVSAPGTVEVGGNLTGDDYKDGTPLDKEVTKESNNRNTVSAPAGVSVGGKVDGVNVLASDTTLGGDAFNAVFKGNVTFTTPADQLRTNNIFISGKSNIDLHSPQPPDSSTTGDSGGDSFTDDIINSITSDTLSGLVPNSDGSTDFLLDPYKKWNTETHLTDNDKSEMVELTICRGIGRDTCESVYMDNKHPVWLTHKPKQ